MEGVIINIQRYSIHDGPGIRTTVFFKGCPLHCWWCHNPESQNFKQDIMYFENRCQKCGFCVKNCPKGALFIKDDRVLRDEEKCIFCGKCENFCPVNALEIVGRTILEQELLNEIQKDRMFYEESGGGVTFSGGEVLYQIDFLEKMIDKCKMNAIHVSVDTCGYGDWKRLERIASKTDLFLYDLKVMNDEKHKKYTGVSNKTILENLKKLSSIHPNIWIRVPLIEGVNCDEENIQSMIDFLKPLNIQQVNLLPYHNTGMDKYTRLNREYKAVSFGIPSDERMNQIKASFEAYGIYTKIGG
ncbi:pyruvate formate lyase activating enzyme [Caminicella sporogenes DSM 14501]|uniref:Pyruvate formate lyase activating enzyme n=1 Tax=Caminicella sporogenes DSM 14501 TaxID=1121266 RepID=A0A1M6T5I9_9FIRM|nr:trans-4-hydroxy-L-proline dehydratase activase [Caminicella sporogenes]RKD25480.1 radical SAM protein [Caminicella sporogenes]SHK51988.1 pyruvate formate lyase activating enzyme [Caminicella sporogenes DSM 14501]